MSIPPIIPLQVNRVWRSYTGGANLDRLAGNKDGGDTHFPEDWLLSTTRAVNPGRDDPPESGESAAVIWNRVLPLSQLLRQYPETMLGAEHVAKHGMQPGFLLKLLDSAVRLHIQCHPTREFSRKRLNANAGKAEGYFILATREHTTPYIYLGFQRPPGREEFKQAILSQDTKAILACFDPVPIKSGDVFFVPGGVPHAIGAGVLMVEIMEDTDYAVRIEFECAGYRLPEASRFMGRDVEFALDMFTFTRHSPERLRNELFVLPQTVEQQPGGELTALFHPGNNDCFQLNKLTVRESFVFRQDTFHALAVTRGTGRIVAGTCAHALQPGARFFLPADAREFTLTADSNPLEAVLATR